MASFIHTLLARGSTRCVWLALAGCSALCILASVASPARAHAPPEVQRIVWKSARELVLVSNRGLMFGSLDAPIFRLMCNEALHINNTEQPHIAYRRDGALLAATSNGLFQSDDQGCSWQPVAPLGASFVSALVQMPDDPDALIAATFGAGMSALHVTHDGGRNWSLLTQLADRDYTQTLLVAPQDPALLYASGTLLVETPMPHTVQYVTRSKDAGKTWERTEIALQTGELYVLLLAINPAHGDELLARASSASPGLMPERLLVSRDGGKTFASPLSLPVITDATFAADGSAAWLSSSTGVYRAGPTRDAFELSGSADHLTCIEAHQGALWTCGRYQGAGTLGDGVGQSADASAMFGTVMNFSDVQEPIACPEAAPTTSLCRTPWLDFHDEVTRGQPTDAGVPPSTDAAATLAIDDAGSGDDDAGNGDDGAAALDADDSDDAGSEPRRRVASCALSTEAGTKRGAALAGALTLCVFALFSSRNGRTPKAPRTPRESSL